MPSLYRFRSFRLSNDLETMVKQVQASKTGDAFGSEGALMSRTNRPHGLALSSLFVALALVSFGPRAAHAAAQHHDRHHLSPAHDGDFRRAYDSRRLGDAGGGG